LGRCLEQANAKEGGCEVWKVNRICCWLSHCQQSTFAWSQSPVSRTRPCTSHPDSTVHSQTHTCMRTHNDTYTHTHHHIYTHAHTHAHTHTHTRTPPPTHTPTTTHLEVPMDDAVLLQEDERLCRLLQGLNGRPGVPLDGGRVHGLVESMNGSRFGQQSCCRWWPTCVPHPCDSHPCASNHIAGCGPRN